MSAQMYLLISAFSLVTNLVVLVAIFWTYRQNKKVEKILHTQEKEIIEKAHKKAEEIILQAGDKAHQIVSQSEILKQELINSIETNFKEVASKDLGLLENKSVEINEFYKNLLDSISTQHLKKTGETLKSIDEIVQKELADFREVLKKETVQSEDIVLKRANEEYVKIKKDIDAYREEKIKEINLAVNQMILKVSEEVLGKALNMNEHQKLITDSLEQALKEGLLKAEVGK
jgi:uncharacterized protein (UPF0333 family)